MNRHPKFRSISLLIGSLFCGPSLFAGAAPDQQAYVVTVRPDASVDGIRAIAGEMAASYGGRVVEGMARGEDTFVIRVSQSRARVLAVDPRVKSVAPMRLTPSPQAVVETVPWSSGVSYSYDGTGNVSQIGSDAFVYDGASRLTQATVNSVHRTYQYDAFGNRTGCTQFGPNDCQGSLVNATENKNRLEGAGYDAAGNVTGQSGHVYSYDPLNMMTRDSFGQLSREFVYTADDERIATYTVGSAWSWTIRGTDGRVLREFTSGDGPAGPGTSSWQWTKDNVWRDGLLLASRQSGGTNTTAYHYHLDHLGTPRRVTDQNDRITGVHDYLAFGPEISGGTAEPFATALKYTGQERDNWASGSLDSLDYMHARYYSSFQGRFLSVDGVLDTRRAQKNPQSWNRYSYVVNNVLAFIDPSGDVWVQTGSGAGLTWTWADECGDNFVCRDSVAVQIDDDDMRVYGPDSATDIHDYTTNDEGYIDLSALDANGDYFTFQNGITATFVSPGTAVAFFNTAELYHEGHPNDEPLSLNDAGRVDGAAFAPHHTHDQGRAVDLRYIDSAGHPIQGPNAVDQADDQRMRTLFGISRIEGFNQNYTDDNVDYGTRWAPGHRNHAHLGRRRQ